MNSCTEFAFPNYFSILYINTEEFFIPRSKIYLSIDYCGRISDPSAIELPQQVRRNRDF